MTNPVPVLAAHRAGEPFDFRTHANDFLLRREQARATETFLVRVPGLGAVPDHVHTDMEQTFVFVSGVCEATLSGDRGQHLRRICLPGDMLFVPAGWHHAVGAKTIEGASYLTVNAFLAGVERVGDSAVGHATMARAGFDARPDAVPSEQAPDSTVDALTVFRTAECAFQPDEGTQRAWPQDFTSPRATLTRDPNEYRVRRIGPFEYVKAVERAPRSLTERHADELYAAAGDLPVFVEGSQSPLSVKQPCTESDLDLLIAVQSSHQLEAVDATLNQLRNVAKQIPVPLSVGVVHEDWLRLPNFYTALSLDPASPDRRFWQTGDEERLAEATRRVTRALALTHDLAMLRDLLERSLALAGKPHVEIDEWRVIPRWRGYR